MATTKTDQQQKVLQKTPEPKASLDCGVKRKDTPYAPKSPIAAKKFSPTDKIVTESDDEQRDVKNAKHSQQPVTSV